MAQYHIPQEMIDDLRLQVDIVEVVSEAGIALRQRGKNYFGLCPFHQEDTPSFSVSPERQWYRCFGCNESGNVFHFLMKVDGLTFPEALQQLADRAGVNLPGSDSAAKRPRVTGLRELHKFTVDHFHKQLLSEGSHALRYLRDRGVKMETIREFKLGFAPQSWDGLMKAAMRSGFGLQLLLEGGLIKETDGKRYDTFRNRVMFPINDEQGNPVAFGGRALDDSPAKYMNSPETPLYQKSRVIYNLDAARASIQQSGEVILVEGYMDALIPYQEGIHNIVASLGTALTDQHVRLIRRYADRVVLTYDGDKAGFNAALRGLHLLLKDGLQVRIATLPDEMDPDDLVCQQGADALLKYLQNAMNLVVFQLKMLSQPGNRNLHRTDDKTKVIKELASTLVHIESHTELDEYVHQAAADLMVEQTLLWRELQRLGVRVQRPKQNEPVRQKRSHPRVLAEQRLLQCIFLEPSLLAEARDVFQPSDFSQPEYARIAALLWSWEGGKQGLQTLADECEDEELRGTIVALAWDNSDFEDVESTFQRSLDRLRDYTLKQLELSRRQAIAESNDLDSLRELLELRARRKK